MSAAGVATLTPASPWPQPLPPAHVQPKDGHVESGGHNSFSYSRGSRWSPHVKSVSVERLLGRTMRDASPHNHWNEGLRNS